jgi:HTH-type transcriptional regulator / antitoxin HipB
VEATMIFPIKTLNQLPLVLKAFRKEKGLTQAAMAEKLGITQQSYAYFEANPATATLARLFTVLRLLNVDISLALAAPAVGTESESAAQIANRQLTPNGMVVRKGAPASGGEGMSVVELANQGLHYPKTGIGKGSKAGTVKVSSQEGRARSAKAKPVAVLPKKKESW